LRAYLMGKGLGAAVKGHRDFYSTSCPGDRLYRLVRDGTFAKPPKGSKTTPISSEEGDVSAQDVIHGKHIVMNKGEDAEKKVSLAAFLQEIETEQDQTQERLDRIEAKLDSLLVKLDDASK
ncbi:hypothetical protein ACQEUU_28640, partial [Nonomuraea sp. CA-218870]